MARQQPLDQGRLKKQLSISNFEPNAIIRGAQLTLVGGECPRKGSTMPFTYLCQAHRALQNPGLFTSSHYKQAAIAVVVGIGIRLAISIPVSTPKIPLQL